MGADLTGSSADYTIELISIETYAPQFIGHNEIFQGSVNREFVRQTSSYFFKGQSIGMAGLACPKSFRLVGMSWLQKKIFAD